ncbi:MAG: helix-turn-helix transcriptional regulator [Ruminococcaceae bacterium]|nr:helix-turn-helix transcriptional regulator [Oscillospiraceae bacterium]
MKKISYYNNKNIISQKLKELREKKGLSQSNLAAKLQIMNVNIDQQMISKIEKNNRQVTDYELACICQCLSVTPNDLLNFFEMKFE